MSGAERIAVAMSGGVDSSVAAALLVESGHREAVVGLTMSLSGGAEASIEEARAAAAHLGIEHAVVDLRQAFEERVLRRCWEEYAAGRTPNPCVLCNEAIKFGALLEAARRRGSPTLATGHHARLRPSPEGGPPILARGRDLTKDQSYFLARLSPEQLSAARFPVGELTKDQVRALARARGLPSAERQESQDTCVALTEATGREGAFAETLRQRFGAQAEPGELILHETGEVIGHHQGVHRFTVGQRRGLGVSLGFRAYVSRIDGEAHRVTLARERAALLARGLTARGVRWLRPAEAEGRALAQIRYRHAPVEAAFRPLDEGSLLVEFVEPVAAVTPGQALVLYDGDEVLGCGWIELAHL